MRRALATVLVMTASVAHAAPVIIRDEMISDPAITPALGRGYSIATNTFQSMCLATAPKTRGSYNFIYSFEELDALATDKPDVNVSAPGSGPTDRSKEVQLDISGAASYTDVAGKRWYRHFIKVSIKLELYYASIDESKATLSESAGKLLAANDLPGFFDACGVYYTRNINRRSTYLSLFSYETETSTRDAAFETALKNEITKLGPGTPTPLPAPPARPPSTPPTTPPTTGTTPTTPPTTGTVTATPPSLEQQISTRKTTIRTFAFGLGKDDKMGELIAYDLNTFKAAIKVGFAAMQSDDVGIVTSIEVVPWVENPLFQAALTLPAREIDDPTVSATPPPGGQAPPKLVVSPYVQKRILTQNSEFLGEVDRSARARLVNYFRARACKVDIERNWGKRGTTGYDLGANASRQVVNNRTGADPMPLSQLYTQHLSDAAVKALMDEYDTFQYRTAQACLDQLLTTSFTLKMYRTIPTCAGIEPQLVVASGRVIEDYCLPSFAKAGAGGTNP